MIVDIVMPKMGESITEGTILEWRKKVGDSIAMDEIILEIGTDKVDSEIPSPTAGVLVEIIGQPNDVMEVGAIIAKVETDQLSTKIEEKEEVYDDSFNHHSVSTNASCTRAFDGISVSAPTTSLRPFIEFETGAAASGFGHKP